MRITWRITEVWQKVIYVVIGYAAIALVFLGLRTWLLDVRSWPYALLALIVDTAYTVLGVRIFRGYRESVAAPRPWWRWTGRPKAGFWLGSFSLLATLGAIGNFWPQCGFTPDIPSAILSLIGTGILSFGYLNSSIRLRRQPELWSQKRIAKPPIPSTGQ